MSFVRKEYTAVKKTVMVIIFAGMLGKE